MSGVPSTARRVAEWLRLLAANDSGQFRRLPAPDELSAAALYLEQLADEWEPMQHGAVSQ